MNDRDEDISPVRAKSKLKKRRRQRESDVSSSCSLIAANNERRCNNFDPTSTKDEKQYHNPFLQKENNYVNVAKSSFLPDNRNRGVSDPSSRRNNNSKNKNDDGTTVTSNLSFIDEMDMTQLSSIEKDVMSSFVNVGVTSELERAFASMNEVNDDTTTTYGNNGAFYHNVIGRIGPPCSSGGDNGTFSIAFPRINTTTDTIKNARVEGQSFSLPSQRTNLKRQTCFGMNIPLSCCQFPGSHSEQNNHRTKTNTDSPTATDVTINQIDNATSNEQATEKDDVISMPSLLQYQGIIRITSDKGATIREMFDIDESEYVVGKLYQGDERYFIEKRTLPAPPPDSDDDESDDEDCVAVVRYKIVLNEQQDCVGCSHEFIERDSTSGKMVAWISDRGRLAKDPYFILKELDF